MNDDAIDVLIIGGGPAGYVGAIRARQLGLKTVLIDERKSFGGTCLNVGCIPSKALLYSSEFFSLCKEKAGEHGISFGDVSLDFSRMMKRKDGVVSSLTEGIKALLTRKGVQLKNEKAKFISPDTVELTDGSTLKAKHILIATGSKPNALPFLPFDKSFVVSSDDALFFDQVPKNLLVVGAGVIGCEIASIYRRLGASVHLIEMLDHIIDPIDLTAAKELQKALTKQGLTFDLESKVKKGEVQKDRVILTVEKGGKEELMEADKVLVAIGRFPNTSSLNLESAGVKVNKRGQIEVDGSFRTSKPAIFAVGDVIDGPMLAHKASREAIAAVEIMKGLKPLVRYEAIPNVVYTSPEVASIGLSEEEAKEAGRDLIIGKSFVKANPRARCQDHTEGLVKVLFDKKTKRFLGGHIVAEAASEMIHTFLYAIEQKLTLEEMETSCYAHPTVSETIMEAIQDADGRAIH